MKIKLHTPVGYCGVMWSVGYVLEIPDENAEAFKNYGVPVEGKEVECGEKSCVEPPVTDAKKNKATTTPSNKARSAKKK